MKRWPIKLLGEVAQVTAGNPAPQRPEDFADDGFPFVRMQDVGRFGQTTHLTETKDKISASASSKLKRFPIGSILVPKSGASIRLNHRAILGIEAHVVSHLAVIAPHDALNNRFAYYWLCGIDLSGVAHDADLPSMKTSELAKLQIPVPPLAEQERIVKLLDKADELRKLRAQADHRTTNLIPALFHEMFAEDSDWPVEQLENLCERVTVGHVGPMATEYIENGVTFLRGQNIKRGWLDLSSVLFVSQDFHRRLGKSAIAPGDVVSVRTGKPGTTAVIPPFLKVANCSDLIVMTCGEKLNPHFLCELLNQRLGDKDNIAGATGMAQQHFNIGEARRLKIALPPLPLQNNFAERVAEIRELEASQATSRTRLDALFQSLLHRAFNGEA